MLGRAGCVPYWVSENVRSRTSFAPPDPVQLRFSGLGHIALARRISRRRMAGQVEHSAPSKACVSPPGQAFANGLDCSRRGDLTNDMIVLPRLLGSVGPMASVMRE